MDEVVADPPKKGKRGFASMSVEKRREIARKGGLAVKVENRSFSKNNDLAKTAGKKGGKSVAPENRSFKRNPESARSAGRKGGLAKRKRGFDV
jgi:general stress protein YciG